MCSETNKTISKSFNGNDKLQNDAINEIKDWLNESNLVVNDDYWILAFLHGTKFKIEKTKQKIKTHLTLRRTTPEWFSNCDPKSTVIQEILDLGVVLPLQQYDEEGRLVIIFRTGVHDPNIYSINDIIKVFHMVLDVALYEMQQATVHGIVAVLDMSGVGFRHIWQVTPNIVRKCIIAWENYCFKPKSIDFCYAPFIFNLILNLAKQLVSKKLLSRLHVHSSSTNICDIVSKDILPIEFNGHAMELQTLIDYWKNKCIEHTNLFKHN